MLGEATLHVSRTFAGERNTASHSVCRPAKALPWGLWHPILMQFYSGPLMHLLSGVDTKLGVPGNGLTAYVSGIGGRARMHVERAGSGSSAVARADPMAGRGRPGVYALPIPGKGSFR